jgi:N-acetylglucosaminyl-diphospho-decaprenol L-rhamnosyltransferase
MLDGASVLVITVGYRNAQDVLECAGALARSHLTPSFSVYICENGGAKAFDALVAALTSPQGPCPGEDEAVALDAPTFRRVRRLQLRGPGCTVLVGEATENLGYAGGVNAWLKVLASNPDWRGVWVLNPDSQPTPDALAELVRCAEERGKGMVGSRILFGHNAEIVDSRGLKWRKFLASTRGVDIYAPASVPPDIGDVESRIDSPSGASVYVTRQCIEQVGLMDERFFLYFEDLDWGLRAKAICGVSYAFHSIVPHVGGSTLGSRGGRTGRSRLSVYLDFRNRLLFVRKHYPGWFAWTIVLCAGRAAEFLLVGATVNFNAALAGIRAGLKGETGRPDLLLLQEN